MIHTTVSRDCIYINVPISAHVYIYTDRYRVNLSRKRGGTYLEATLLHISNFPQIKTSFLTHTHTHDIQYRQFFTVSFFLNINPFPPLWTLFRYLSIPIHTHRNSQQKLIHAAVHPESAIFYASKKKPFFLGIKRDDTSSIRYSKYELEQHSKFKLVSFGYKLPTVFHSFKSIIKHKILVFVRSQHQLSTAVFRSLHNSCTHHVV